MVRILTCVVLIFTCSIGNAQKSQVWTIGTKNNSTSELALGPAGYKKFLEKDFGYEDRYYLIGKSTPENDFPYVIPGPDDTWGGTWSTSGWRTHEINILFGIKTLKSDTKFDFVIDLFDSSPVRSLLKVTINDSQSEKFELKGKHKESLTGEANGQMGQTITIPVHNNVLHEGGNKITLTVLEGSWVLFDAVRLDASRPVALEQPDKVFIRAIRPANYELSNEGKRFQPLLVDVEHLKGRPALSVELDGKIIFKSQLDTARYQFEAPMPAVSSAKESKYNILVDGKPVSKGKILRSPQKLNTFADYVDTKIGTAHSRWMIAPGPWMPMSMVKLSPDNQNRGWQAGYQPTFETVGCFSHIHEWTMGGLGLMPTNGALQIQVGDQFDPDSGYRSRIDKMTEEAPLGHYKVYMTDTEIWADITATTRCGFQRYTFPDNKVGRVMIDLHVEAEYDYNLVDIKIEQTSDYRIEGYSHQISPRPHVWSNDADQEYTIHFVIEFDQPIKNMGGWINKDVIQSNRIAASNIRDAGAFVEFDTKKSKVVQVRTGISLVSIKNAAENLETEITKPFNWDFQAVVENQKKVWNDIFSRVDITTNDRLEKLRFYTNVYRALCRNTWSDVNGEWMSAGGKLQRFMNPNYVAMGCDAFWNTFWNLNQFWNLITPEWSSRWVHSQLGMFDADGWLAKGPAGMKYIPVMVAEHEIPLIVSAYQMGIRDFDAEKALKAMIKMQTTPASPVATGFAGNRDLVSYMKHKYVPSDLGRFSNTFEYSFDDWTVGQFAKALGNNEAYKTFNERGYWWKNAINPANGYAHLRKSDGNFTEDFDPFRSGANQQYVEGNAWQLSYFVPQDIPALIDILGEKAFVERLDWGFTASEPWRYNAPNDQYWDYPVVQGNQQSMHFAFLFNWANHPWLTQRWSRSIIDKYYGYGIANAYLGDEDQGQMSAWLVMASLGLFQTDGGCNTTPIYEIASPLYEKVVIDLGKRYGRGEKFTITANGASRKNKYVQHATLNGKELKTFWFPASELLKGGELVLQMGDQPNKAWGIGNPPITRGDAAAIIVKEFGFTGSRSISVNDVKTSHKHYANIMECISRNIFGEPSIENYNFRPDDILTQYELAKLSVYLYAALLCVEDENIAPGGRREIPNMENLSPEKKWYVYCAAENGFIDFREFNPGSAVRKAELLKCLKAIKTKAAVSGTDYESYAATKLANFRSFPARDIPAAGAIDVFKINTNDRGIRLFSSTLQGLVNRDTIRLFINPGNYDWMPQFAIDRGYFSGRETALTENDWEALLTRYSSFIKKAIVWDTINNFSINFCVNIAAVEDRVLLTENMVAAAKKIIPKLDVSYFSGYKINSQLEAQRYNYENEFPHLRRDVIGWNYYSSAIDFLRDYSIQMKMPTMWVPGNNSPDYNEKTLIEAKDILHKYPAAIPMLGFGYASDNINGKSGNYGLDEFPAVKLHGEYGKYTAVFDIVGNLSFHSPLKIDPEKKKFNQTAPERITYDSNKKYVAVTMTESGDSPAYIQYGMSQWRDKERGTIPFSMCYGLLNYDIYPLLTEYFVSTQTPKDFMFGAISGLGYNYPLIGFGSKGVIDDDGILYMDQEMIMKDHYTKANDLSKKLNFKSLGVYSFPSSKWSKDNYRDFDRWVAQYMPFIQSFVGDMHRPEKLLLSKDELHAVTAYGQNIFHCSTFWYIGPRLSEEELVEYLANEIIKHTTFKGELYHCMAYSWHYGPRRIKMAMEKIIKKHPEYVFVTFDQLDLLQEQRNNKY